jgi:hypothetical protein
MIEILVLGAVCACVGALRLGSGTPASAAAGARHPYHAAAGCEGLAVPTHASADRVFTILAMQ